MKSLKRLLAVLAIICCLAACTFISASANQTAFTKVMQSKIDEIFNDKSVAEKNMFVMKLTETDFTTLDGHNETMWINADYKEMDLSNADLTEKDVCNFLLNKNLSDYNFESKVLIDGVPLSQYKNENPYFLVGNLKQRPDTLSITFDKDIVGVVQTVEILAGCQFPTFSSGCLGDSELSCIEITEGVKYQNADGKWNYYFEGYEEGVQYVADEKMFATSNEKSYKGSVAVPMAGFTTFFDGRDVSGEFHTGKALASRGNTEKDNIVIIRLLHPVDSNKFDTIALRLQSNHARTIISYSDENGNSLGNALESFTLNGWSYTTIKLTSALYADENGLVNAIIFKFQEDGEPILNDDKSLKQDENGIVRDSLHVMSISVENDESGAILSSESFMIFETKNSFDITFRFNKVGVANGNVELDLTKVTLNGSTLARVLSECKTATAEWQVIGSIFQIFVRLPKDYNGSAAIKNLDLNYTSNNMGVLKGLEFPNGEILEKDYTCHLYAHEKILDSELVNEYEPIKVEGVKVSFVSGSENIKIVITFDKKLSAQNYVHVCEVERWRKTDLAKADASYYDSEISRAFVNGGFKTSLLDNVVINGKTIGEWHSQKGDVSLTNIQVHYGTSGLYNMDIAFEKKSPTTYNMVYDNVASGNGLTVEIKEGLKFTTNNKVMKTQTFTLVNGKFSEVVENKNIHVYYDGSEIANGANLTLNADVSTDSLVVACASAYTVSSTQNGNKTEFTITYDTSKTFTFTVTKNGTPSEIVIQMGSSAFPQESEEGGCGSAVGAPFAIGALLLLAAAKLIFKEKIS